MNFIWRVISLVLWYEPRTQGSPRRRSWVKTASGQELPFVAGVRIRRQVALEWAVPSSLKDRIRRIRFGYLDPKLACCHRPRLREQTFLSLDPKGIARVPTNPATPRYVHRTSAHTAFKRQGVLGVDSENGHRGKDITGWMTTICLLSSHNGVNTSGTRLRALDHARRLSSKVTGFPACLSRPTRSIVARGKGSWRSSRWPLAWIARPSFPGRLEGGDTRKRVLIC
ncbi:hypothetical protein LZ31DRAFT_83630 [Colletotrichum somersetense]|nr:hypothetical protein LZ31DRAFT_83630 [Colletotrichum somersetense]